MTNRIITIVSLIVLISVHIIEFIGFAACDLCLKQRWAWYLVLIIALIPFIVTISFNKILLLIISIVLFCNAIFAGWHAGIEWDLWSGLATCNSSAIFDNNNLVETLKEGSVPVCDGRRPTITDGDLESLPDWLQEIKGQASCRRRRALSLNLVFQRSHQMRQ